MLEYAITLTVADERKEYDTAIKNLFNSIRKMSQNRGWKYEIKIGKSIINIKTNKKVRLHYHCYVKGNPATTIIRYIKNYWENRGLGNAKYSEKIKNTDAYLVYIKKQASFLWEQTNIKIIENFIEQPNKLVEKQQNDFTSLDTSDSPKSLKNQKLEKVKKHILVYIYNLILVITDNDVLKLISRIYLNLFNATIVSFLNSG